MCISKQIFIVPNKNLIVAEITRRTPLTSQVFPLKKEGELDF